MLTNQEHKKIYNLVDRFGGEEKIILRSTIISLINDHRKRVLKELVEKLI